MPTLFRILSRENWQAALREGVFRGTSHDLRDGFIHFSLAHQLEETRRKHYADQSDLLLLQVSSERLKEAELRWEASRGGQLFPHLYGVLEVGLVERVEELV